jgi:iron-sulfur cluster assembly protein
MLAVTEQAATVIRAIAHRPELPEGAGLRIASDTGAPEDLSVAAAAVPEDGDQVVDENGARVFLDAGVVDLLDDKVLDARVDDGGSAEFLVSER